MGRGVRLGGRGGLRASGELVEAGAPEPRRDGAETVRIEALRPLHYLFLSGTDLERGEFKRMTGLGERTAVTLLSALIARGLLASDTPQGKVRFGLPLHALRFYFPALWPEAEADASR